MQASHHVSLWLPGPTYTSTAWRLPRSAPGVDATALCTQACVYHGGVNASFCMLIVNDLCADLNLQGLIPVAQLPCQQAPFLTAFYGLKHFLCVLFLFYLIILFNCLFIFPFQDQNPLAACYGPALHTTSIHMLLCTISRIQQHASCLA